MNKDNHFFKIYINKIYQVLLESILKKNNKKNFDNSDNFNTLLNIDYENDKIDSIINDEDTYEEKEGLFSIKKPQKILYKCKCIFCKKEPKESLECESCKRFICIDCYMKNLTNNKIFNCPCNEKTHKSECLKEDKNIYSDYFYHLIQEVSNIINDTKSELYIKSQNLINEENKFEYNIIDENDDNNILKINKRNNSIRLIDDYVQKYLNETLNIYNNIFDAFNEKQANNFCK